MPINVIFVAFEGVNDNTLTPQNLLLQTSINTDDLHGTLSTLFRLLWR